jgi:hypothetical protein
MVVVQTSVRLRLMSKCAKTKFNPSTGYRQTIDLGAVIEPSVTLEFAIFPTDPLIHQFIGCAVINNLIA